MFNRVSGVQVVHRPLQRGVAVAARSQIPGGIQVYFGERDAAERAVILHGVAIGVHGVRLLIAGDVGRVSIIGFVAVAVTERNANNALAGVD